MCVCGRGGGLRVAEAGSCVRLIDLCIAQLQVEGGWGRSTKHDAVSVTWPTNNDPPLGMPARVSDTTFAAKVPTGAGSGVGGWKGSGRGWRVKVEGTCRVAGTFCLQFVSGHCVTSLPGYPGKYIARVILNSSEAGSYLRLIDSCITQLKAQGTSRACEESKEEKEEVPAGTNPVIEMFLHRGSGAEWDGCLWLPSVIFRVPGSGFGVSDF